MGIMNLKTIVQVVYTLEHHLAYLSCLIIWKYCWNLILTTHIHHTPHQHTTTRDNYKLIHQNVFFKNGQWLLCEICIIAMKSSGFRVWVSCAYIQIVTVEWWRLDLTTHIGDNFYASHVMRSWKLGTSFAVNVGAKVCILFQCSSEQSPYKFAVLQNFPVNFFFCCFRNLFK